MKTNRRPVHQTPERSQLGSRPRNQDQRLSNLPLPSQTSPFSTRCGARAASSRTLARGSNAWPFSLGKTYILPTRFPVIFRNLLNRSTQLRLRSDAVDHLRLHPRSALLTPVVRIARALAGSSVFFCWPLHVWCPLDPNQSRPALAGPEGAIVRAVHRVATLSHNHSQKT